MFSDLSTFKKILYVLGALVPAALIIVARLFVYDTFFIPSPSMEQTLKIGDQIATWRHGTDNIQRGDVIVFDDNLGWIPLKDSTAMGNTLTKRVIGVPGDTVECCTVDNQIIVNGQPVQESYIQGRNTSFEPQTVPDGKIFVMGDNRMNSADSRYHINEDTQFVDIDSVTGVVFAIYWPLPDIRTIGLPEEWNNFNKLPINNK